MPAGVKVGVDGSLFISIPRWNPGVPATLTKLVSSDATIRADGKPAVLLQPYPSWDLNTEGRADALQSVLGFDIDQQHRLWVLDQGRVNNQPAIAGSIKLLAFDLKSDQLVQQYVFPEELASLAHSFLNDLVIDQVNV